MVKMLKITTIMLLILSCSTGKQVVNTKQNKKYVHQCEAMGNYELCCDDSTAIAILILDSLTYHDKSLSGKTMHNSVVLLEKKTGIIHTGVDVTNFGIIYYSPARRDVKNWVKWIEENEPCE